MSQETLLSVEGLQVSYGAIRAIHGIDFEVKKGEIVTLLGANGAGKTTTLQTLSGLVQARKGCIHFKGSDITKTKAYKRVAMGLAQSPEGRLVFPDLTVMENLEMGAYLRKDHAQIKKDLDMMFTLFPRLKERLKQFAGTLSGGEQQMLAIARAHMSAPELLLLDEPSLGIAPLLVKDIFRAIRDLNQKFDKTILLVEQNAGLALKVAHRAYVLETGKITHSGKASDLMNNDDIKKAYLGH